MPASVPMTKLDAVNEMLHDIGERPVNTLVGSARLDVTRAISSLDKTLRTTLIRGWWFNTEEITLSVDGSGNYLLPTDVAHVEVLSGGPSGERHLVVRARKLYDTKNATDVFTGADPVVLIIHRLLEFEQLPASAREYVYAMASIGFQSRTLGARAVDPALKEQAEVALSLMKEEDIDSDNTNATYSMHFFEMMHNR